MSVDEQKLICGIVMPISAIDGCSEQHWADVLDILTDAIGHAGFDSNLVSNADDVGIIHKRIIQNLHDNPVVVCDVSGRNSNVMFELGLRLAFDRPTIIVKDDKTSISFDTSAIEHIEYPRDLRFGTIVSFKQRLAEKISATHKRATTDPSYTTFLKQFGEFTAAKLDKKVLPANEYIIEELRMLRRSVEQLERAPQTSSSSKNRTRFHRGDIDICMKNAPQSSIDEAIKFAEGFDAVSDVIVHERHNDHKHLIVQLHPENLTVAGDIRRQLRKMFPLSVKNSGATSANPGELI